MTVARFLYRLPTYSKRKMNPGIVPNLGVPKHAALTPRVTHPQPRPLYNSP